MSDKKIDPYHLGNSFMFPPHVMNDIHIKAELGRYRMRGFSLFKKIPTWDDLTFMPGTLTRFVIDRTFAANSLMVISGSSFGTAAV